MKRASSSSVIVAPFAITQVPGGGRGHRITTGPATVGEPR
jgi:hypothetical protein